jgi:hypothetical protein
VTTRMRERYERLRALSVLLPDSALGGGWARGPSGWRFSVMFPWCGVSLVAEGPALDLDGVERERGPRARAAVARGCEYEVRRRLRRHLAGYGGEVVTDARRPGVLSVPGRVA